MSVGEGDWCEWVKWVPETYAGVIKNISVVVVAVVVVRGRRRYRLRLRPRRRCRNYMSVFFVPCTNSFSGSRPKVHRFFIVS